MKKLMIILLFSLQYLLASSALNTSYFFAANLPSHDIYIRPDVISTIEVMAEFSPIYHINLTQIGDSSNPEHKCSVYQRRLELDIDKYINLDKNLTNTQYSSLLLAGEHSTLLLLTQEGTLFTYSMDKNHFLAFKSSYDHSSHLSGANNTLVYMSDMQMVIAISSKKAIGFTDLSDFSKFVSFPNFKSVSVINKAQIYAHMLLVASGIDGVQIYEYMDEDLKLVKELVTNPGVYTITDAKDVSFFENTLLVLDYYLGVLFFNFQSYSYEGNNIPIRNGDRFIHRMLDLFYITGMDAPGRYFNEEIFYLKQEKLAIVNRQSFESIPIKHMDIIKDYAFELSGETIKIFYHSIPSEWTQKRYNVVNFLTEHGMKNFFPLSPDSYSDFIGFTSDKIIVLKMKETPPQIYCGVMGGKSLLSYSYLVEVIGKNCPMKHNSGILTPFYSLCDGKQVINIKLTEHRLSKFFSFENFTFWMMVLLSVILIFGCTSCVLCIFRSKKNMSEMEHEIENLKKKFKYQQIVEEKDSGVASGGVELEMKSSDIAKV